MNTIPLYRRYETVLGVLPADTERERVLIIKTVTPGLEDRLELRQQTFGDGVGWFTQTSLPLSPSQVQQLRSTLSATCRPAGKEPTTAENLERVAAERGLSLVR